MGAIRKTMSIATLGLVNWRSKGELLERERAAHGEAVEELDRRRKRLEEQQATSERLGRRARKAEKRLRQAELKALSSARSARRKRRFLRRSHQAREAIKDTSADARADARALTKRTGRKLRKAEEKTRRVVSDAAESVTDTVQEAVDR